MTLRCALYARYSSDQQRAASIEDQFRVCRERAAREGWKIAGAYKDSAISGDSMILRPGIQVMLDDARQGMFEILVAEALDRVSRDQADVATLYKHLRFAGVTVVTLAEGEISELHVGLKGTMNALFLKDLAAKTHRGLRGRVEAGKSGGGLCYGYDVVKSFDGSGDPVRGGRTVNETEAEIVRRVFREFADGASPRAIARRLNGEGVPGPSGKLWMDTTIRGHAKRGTGLINNELYVGRLVWNRLRYVKNPETGKRVSRINPPEEWIVAEVPDLRIVDDALWKAVKDRQGEITVQYATVIEATQSARANRLNGAHRPRHLLSGLLECGVCGGPYSMRGQDRYGCSNHIMTGTCSNGRGIRRAVIEERVLSGLKDRLMAPEAAAEAMRAWAEETNRINRERRASGASDRKELAQVEKKIAAMIAVIEDGGYVRGMVDRLRELEARQDELNERLSAAPADLPDIHPNIADVYRRKVARLAEALDHPEDRDAAAAAIRGLIERIVLTPSEKWAEMDAVLYGDLGAILEWAGNGRENTKTDIPMSEMSVSVVAGAGLEPVTPARDTVARGRYEPGCTELPCSASHTRWGHATRHLPTPSPGSYPKDCVHRETRQPSVGLSLPSRSGLPSRLATRTNTSPFARPALRFQRHSRSADEGGIAARRIIRLRTAPGVGDPFQRGFSRASLTCVPVIPSVCARFPAEAMASQRGPNRRREQTHGQ